jgi:hypothetical protein
MIKNASGVFDKTAFVKFKISDNFEQNIDKTHSKHQKIHTSLWLLKISRKNPQTKSLDTFGKCL